MEFWTHMVIFFSLTTCKTEVASLRMTNIIILWILFSTESVSVFQLQSRQMSFTSIVQINTFALEKKPQVCNGIYECLLYITVLHLNTTRYGFRPVVISLILTL